MPRAAESVHVVRNMKLPKILPADASIRLLLLFLFGRVWVGGHATQSARVVVENPSRHAPQPGLAEDFFLFSAIRPLPCFAQSPAQLAGIPGTTIRYMHLAYPVPGKLAMLRVGVRRALLGDGLLSPLCLFLLYTLSKTPSWHRRLSLDETLATVALVGAFTATDVSGAKTDSHTNLGKQAMVVAEWLAAPCGDY